MEPTLTHEGFIWAALRSGIIEHEAGWLAVFRLTIGKEHPAERFSCRAGEFI